MKSSMKMVSRTRKKLKNDYSSWNSKNVFSLHKSLLDISFKSNFSRRQQKSSDDSPLSYFENEIPATF